MSWTGALVSSPNGNTAWAGNIAAGTRIVVGMTPMGVQAFSLGRLERDGRDVPIWSFWNADCSVGQNFFPPGYPMLEAVSTDGESFLAFAERPPNGIAPAELRNTHGLGNVGTRLRHIETVVPFDGVWWSNHTGQIGGRADTPAAMYAHDGLIMRAGMIVGVGVHIIGAANNVRSSHTDVNHIRNPRVLAAADGSLRLADRSGHAWAQHWGNHGNWQGTTALRYVRPATRAELARVPMPDYVRLALGIAAAS